VRAADTSLVVAAFASWHEWHDVARRALDVGLRLVEHCALETYSVLTRLPAPHRAGGDIVRDFIKARFSQPFLRLSAGAYREFLLGLPDREVAGGVAYDALVAATAAEHAAELFTCGTGVPRRSTSAIAFERTSCRRPPSTSLASPRTAIRPPVSTGPESCTRQRRPLPAEARTVTHSMM
jgi:predicted nucleic acid-binding protein